MGASRPFRHGLVCHLFTPAPASEDHSHFSKDLSKKAIAFWSPAHIIIALDQVYELGEMNMDKVKIIALKESVLEDNDQDAQALREELRAGGTCLLNLMSAPGSGKTTTLLALNKAFDGRLRWGVMEADIDSAVDANTMLEAGVPSVQLHTGGMCHLDADMTRQGIRALGMEDAELIVLENIGNLVCPAEFDTGAAINMTILSVPEGDDKPAKYPLMYETCDMLVVNKIDTLPIFDFDKEKMEGYARARNPEIEIFYISAKTGEGVQELADALVRKVKEWNAK